MRFRALLLGFAAVLFGCVSAAIAADLPIAEPADQYVRICDAFGAGFFYIPGTDTCLKLGGYVRAESHYVDGDTEILLGGGTNPNSTTGPAAPAPTSCSTRRRPPISG